METEGDRIAMRLRLRARRSESGTLAEADHIEFLDHHRLARHFMKPANRNVAVVMVSSSMVEME